VKVEDVFVYNLIGLVIIKIKKDDFVGVIFFRNFGSYYIAGSAGVLVLLVLSVNG
jgi:hypothetical protein